MDHNSDSDSVDRWARQPIPEKLWHYTSVQGFHGIVSSGSIYATDVRFLNDAEEFVHARKVAEDLVKGAEERGEYGFPLRWHLEWLVKNIFQSDFLNPSKAQIFVVSFTDSEDDLSQWRAYSHGSHGVSISFDLRVFRPPTESDSAVTFAPCVYCEKTKREMIQGAFGHFMNVTEAWWAAALNRFLMETDVFSRRPSLAEIEKFISMVFGTAEHKAQMRIGLNEALKRVIRLSGLLKHGAFHHEREWRLVLPISPGKDKTKLAHPIRFRPTSASLIPYIEFPLKVISTSTMLGIPPAVGLPINDVLLGPGASEDEVASAAEFLRSNSVNVSPRKSAVPFRGA
ncbi:MAG: DUF2971 domain-containing protein [Acidobacteriaceae bacterium]